VLLFYLSVIDTLEGKTQFELLYEKYRWLMYKTAYNILREHQAAEDAVHDAFMRVALSLNSIDDVDSPKTRNFLVIITRNISLNMYKRRKRIDLSNIGIERPGVVGVDNHLIEKESYNELVKEILKLPGKYADVLFLRYDNEYSISEIAKMLNMSYANAQKTIERARKALDKRLYDKEGELIARKIHK